MVRFDTHVRIGSRLVGPGHPAYIVAELSANHNGSLDRAIETVRAAAAAGADAIKLQTYTADTLTIDDAGPLFTVPGDGPWSGRTLYELYQEASTPWEWHESLFGEARACGIDVFSTPFDQTAIDLLESLDVPVYKVASFELVDDHLLGAVARTGKPVILSTGMASLEEIDHALDVLAAEGARGVALLRCTSSYPAPDSAMDLASIPALMEHAGCPVGLSDHSMGTTAPVVARVLGACFIEKHFTLTRTDGGVDSHFSLCPDEFTELVQSVRRAEAMMGEPRFGAGVAEQGNVIFRRSLFAVADIGAGEELTDRNIRSIRPGFGLAPRHYEAVLGSRAIRAIPRGTPLSWDLMDTSVEPISVQVDRE